MSYLLTRKSVERKDPKMLAMMLYEPERFSVIDVPQPEPGPGQALVRVRSAGICASDIATIRGYSPIAAYPVIPGHECIGEVVTAEAGSGYKPGDLVTVFPSVGCGACKACDEGRTNHCAEFKVLGIGLPGGCFAEYIVVDNGQLVPISEEIYQRFGPLVEPLAVGSHVNRRGGTQPGETVLVIGAGAIGLCCALIARSRGARRVVLVDRFESRGAVARQLGFDDFTTASGPDLVAWLADTVGQVDLVLDNACTRETLKVGTQALRPGGRVVLVGLPHGDSEIPIPYTDAYRKEINFLISRNYMRQDFIDTIEAIEQGMVDPSPLVTATFPLAEMGAALEQLAKHPDRHIKVLVTPPGS